MVKNLQNTTNTTHTTTPTTAGGIQMLDIQHTLKSLKGKQHSVYAVVEHFTLHHPDDAENFINLYIRKGRRGFTISMATRKSWTDLNQFPFPTPEEGKRWAFQYVDVNNPTR